MKKNVSVIAIIFALITTSTITSPLFSIHAEDADPYVEVNKTATAYEITCGQEILINLTVRGLALGGPFDIVLVIDRSGSMANDNALEDAKAAAISFVENRTFTADPTTSDWVGVVSYSSARRGHPDAAILDQGLTNDPNLLKWAIGNLTTNGRTNIMAGVHIAQEELANHGRAQVKDVIALLSDGVANQWTDFTTGESYDQADANGTHTTSTLKAIQEATWAKGNGTIVFTIGLRLAELGPGVTEIAIDTLQQMATSLDYFFDADEPGYLEEIYGIISSYIGPAATDLTITDTVEDEFTIVMDSFDPDYTTLVGNTITWEFPVLGSENRTFLYKIRPIRGLNGWYPTNVEANLTYTDHEDNPASLDFPIPEVYLYRVCESAIELIKTADPTLINPGDKVTYTYNVSNPGPYPLHNINLTDDQYGKIAGPFDLAVGESRIFTHDAYPTDTIINWGNATGFDPWNYPVTALDDALVEVLTMCTVYFYTVPSNVGNITIVGGETYLNGESGTWEYCTNLTAIANAPVGYVFDRWEVMGNLDNVVEDENSVDFHIACGGNITAYFKPERCTVYFYTDPSDVGNITIEDITYFNGDSDTWNYCDTFTAIANAPEGYVFDRWEVTGNIDILEEVDNSIRVHIVCGGSIKAYFKPVECIVTFFTVPSDVGNITIVGGETYLNGESDTWEYCTTLTAIANAPVGYVFDKWEVKGNLDVLAEVGNQLEFHIACGGNITAYFKPERCTVYFYTDPSDVGNITIVGGETYLNGESDTWDYCTELTAVANAPEGYIFDRWEITGNLDILEETDNTIRFHIACGGTLKAYFTHPRAKITGGGQGDIGVQRRRGIPGGSFGFNVMWFSKDPGPTGELNYVDHTTGMHVHAHVIEYLMVWEVSPQRNKPWPLRRGIFGGPCTINGEEGYTFEVYIEDNGEPGRNDVFQITLSTGYVGGSRFIPISCGNIQIHKPPK